MNTSAFIWRMSVMRGASAAVCLLACAACARERGAPYVVPALALPGPAPVIAPPAAATRGSRAAYGCNLLLGVAVTSEWFEAGFERVVDDARWEAITKPHTSLTEWSDANDPVWSLAPSSPCAEGANAPERVLFTAMKWEYKTAEEWASGLRGVVQAIKRRYPSVRRIELLTMIRAPHNASCGNAMSVVEPFVDEAVARVAAEQPELVKVGAKHEAPSCDLFKNGGPHFTDEGRAAIAKQLGEYYAHEPAQ